MTLLLHYRLFAAALLCSALGGCSAIMRPIRSVSHLGGEITLDISIDPDANSDMPIAVDVVVVRNSKTFKDLSAMSAQAWFAKRVGFRRMHTDLNVYSWEWVPGQEIPVIRISQTAVAEGVVLFANYTAAGEHTALLPRSGVIKLELASNDFKITSRGS